MKHIAVIGAGIAGLTCAYELQKAGFSVTVYEKEDRVGGRMSSRFRKGLIFDIGANHLINLYPQMREYTEEFNIPWQRMDFVVYNILQNNKLIPAMDCINWFTKIRLSIQYFLVDKTLDFLHIESAAKYDTGNAYDYMKKYCGKTMADYLIDGFTSAYQFHRGKEMSMGPLFAVMQSIAKEKEQWYLHRTKGGMIALPNAFKERLDVKLKQEIEHIKAEKKIEVKTKKGVKKYDYVVIATPGTITKKIYKNPSKEQKEFLEQVKFATTISVSFRVPTKDLPGISTCWVPYIENQKICSFTNETMKGEEMKVKDHTLFCVWLHEEFAKKIIKKSDKQIFEAVKKEFAQICPWVKESELENHDLERWPNAMPKFYPGYLKATNEFLENGQGDKNIYLCGDYLNAPWTEGAIRCGQRVAKAIASRDS